MSYSYFQFRQTANRVGKCPDIASSILGKEDRAVGWEEVVPSGGDVKDPICSSKALQ